MMLKKPIDYYRIQNENSVNAVRKEIAGRGYDPSRIIIGDQRTIYNKSATNLSEPKSLKEKTEIFNIKIIPDLLIK